jgi:purine-cytosine permease-like protein
VYAILAIVIGVGLGTLHGLPRQPGPAHGLAADDPVARQFGLRGAIVPFIAVIFMYIGFNVFNVILATDAINTVLPGSQAPWYALMIVLAVVIAVISHLPAHGATLADLRDDQRSRC